MDIQTAMKRVDRAENGCWQWLGSVDKYGYGKICVNTKWQRAHRFFYIHLKGIPGPSLDHLCRNRACVNPDHLEPVSPVENTMRGNSPHACFARLTHCKHGHPFDATNTGRLSGSARRVCKMCDVIRHRKARERRARIGAKL